METSKAHIMLNIFNLRIQLRCPFQLLAKASVDRTTQGLLQSFVVYKSCRKSLIWLSITGIFLTNSSNLLKDIHLELCLAIALQLIHYRSPLGSLR